MHFERDLPTYAEPVAAGELQVGETYFAVQYLDQDLLLPTLETLILTDKKQDESGRTVFLFQDLGSHQAGIRHGSPETDSATFYFQSEENLRHIFDYDNAVDELIKCALRRHKRTDYE